ncbi:cupredoxin domain-containing protein [Microvirga antarctica]|uniref:cupredoxin domain-containing protein n=1 Tax=Microvirga antarctica TaxID=2819233 RepID=UPI001B300E0D|nr:cupredoxin family protein [Microvirga antarctica]
MHTAHWFAAGLTAALFTTAVAIAAPGGAGHHHGEMGPGKAGDTSTASRVIPITLTDRDDGAMRFFPERVEVRTGEQVRFVLRNSGKVEHEFVLDTPANNAAHKQAMMADPAMAHDDPNARRLAASASGEIVWQFTAPGEYEYACLIPGHYEAGMRGTVVVR